MSYDVGGCKYGVETLTIYVRHKQVCHEVQYHSGVPNLCTCVGRHEEDGVQDQTVA
jgi:hypothetical protein